MKTTIKNGAIVALSTLMLVGCSSVTSATSDTGNTIAARKDTSTEKQKDEAAETSNNVEVSSDKIEIVKEYTVKTNEYSSYTYHIMVVKNNNETQASISSNSKALDSSGNTLGIESARIEVLGPGASTVLIEPFDSIDGVNSYETKLEASSSNYYNEVDSSISMDLDSTSEKVFVTLTNNSEKSALFVEGYVLFFDESGNCIDYESKYIVDNDSEIKAGESISEEFKCNNTFTNAEVYFTGRSE